MNSRILDQDNLQERLKAVQEECRRLREENAHLRAMLGINQSPLKEPVPQAILVSNPSSTTRKEVSTPVEKISLVRYLFHGREDVFATRWESKGGKSGYSPAGICGIPLYARRNSPKLGTRLPQTTKFGTPTISYCERKTGVTPTKTRLITELSSSKGRNPGFRPFLLRELPSFALLVSRHGWHASP